MTALTWLGIVFCVSQSAMFSGLNLAFFSLSKLQLEIEASKENERARKVLRMRKDSNFLLTTILWGNVAINVLLTLLSDSVMVGVGAFFFSTVVITFAGEIIPQAYFSRHALRMASLLSPVLRFYQFVLFVVAKPTAMALDRWLGPEAILLFREADFRRLVEMHVRSDQSDIGKLEGKGALNFLALDDLPVADEGEAVDPRSIVQLDFEGNRPVFPCSGGPDTDRLLKRVHASGKKWIIVTDSRDQPRIVLDSDGFLRSALLGPHPFNPYLHCHRPIIIRDAHAKLGETIPRLRVKPERSDDDVIDEDVILVWNEEKRVITGADILGRLLRGIVPSEDAAGHNN